MSAEISTLVQPAARSLGTLTILRPAATATETVFAPSVAPTPAEAGRPDLVAAGRPPLEPLVDAVLRMLWALVGCYVWAVLLLKGPPPRTSSRELEPIVWPQADYPAVGLPAVGLTRAGGIR